MKCQKGQRIKKYLMNLNSKESDVVTHLARETKSLFFVWKEAIEYLGVVGLGPLEDLLYGKAFILGDHKMLNFVALDPAFLASSLIPQVPDGHGAQRRLVGLAVDGQEAVDLLLGLELGGELFYMHTHLRWLGYGVPVSVHL
jgi:hypothetical protein